MLLPFSIHLLMSIPHRKISLDPKCVLNIRIFPIGSFVLFSFIYKDVDEDASSMLTYLGFSLSRARDFFLLDQEIISSCWWDYCYLPIIIDRRNENRLRILIHDFFDSIMTFCQDRIDWKVGTKRISQSVGFFIYILTQFFSDGCFLNWHILSLCVCVFFFLLLRLFFPCGWLCWVTALREDDVSELKTNKDVYSSLWIEQIELEDTADIRVKGENEDNRKTDRMERTIFSTRLSSIFESR